MSLPAYRYLRGYCLDPGFSTRLDTVGINEVLYRIPYELVQPGPMGEYVDVLDYDPASHCWYEPVDLKQEEIASQQGFAPSEGNPQFHQQFVYAVAMKTIRHFEVALGRKIVWRPRTPAVAGKGKGRADLRRLRIHPHAFREANAYYDPGKGALLFGYFTAAANIQGANFPGGLVFTCLSPDIVAHETTHAILDSLHPGYLEDTNRDVGAFHEAFADIVALLQRFTFRDLLEHQLYMTGGRLDRYNVLGELATQFGEALEGSRGALRSMIGRWNEKGEWVPVKPSPADYSTTFEVHDRGAILVATVFDALQRIYAFRTRDLIRLATNGTEVLPEGRGGRDIVHRLASEASAIAEHLLHICIRALDYCPPNDITFGDYLRALITADIDIAPEDESGYRVALIEAFRARGIFPDRVNTLSVDSLQWSRPEVTEAEEEALVWIGTELRERIRALLDTTNRRFIVKRTDDARAALARLLQNPPSFFRPDKWELFLNRLGLTARPVSTIFGPYSSQVKFMHKGRRTQNYIPPIEVHTIAPAFRAGREGRQIEQWVITLTQSIIADVGLEGESRLMVFQGGCSIIIRIGKQTGADFIVQKNIKSVRRFSRQAEYRRSETQCANALTSTYYEDIAQPWRVDFRLLHRR